MRSLSGIARSGSPVVLAAALAACGGAVAPPHEEPSLTEWTAIRGALRRARAEVPRRAYAARVHVTMREPYGGRTFDARGAVAVEPGRAVRMILVGPGGATALDAWVRADRFRFAVPALDLVRRGTDDGEPAARGLPVGFFRWWFLDPLGGTLLTSPTGPDARTFVLRTGAFERHDAVTTQVTVEPPDPPARIVASRRGRGGTERVTWVGSFRPRAGDHGRYVHEGTGLRVDVTLEEVGDEAPDPEAFRDPDAPEAAPGGEKP